MTIDEVVLLLKACEATGLTTLQEMILRSIWEGKSCTSIAVATDCEEANVSKVAAYLWQVLSNFWREPISKSNLRSVLEPRHLSKPHQQLIREFHQLTTAISLELPNRPVALDSRFYIPHPPIEELIYAEIAKPGSVICINAPKKMGKSSLMLRMMAQAAKKSDAYGKEKILRTINLDLKSIDKAIFAHSSQFWRWFCTYVSRKLQLEPQLDDYWREDLDNQVNSSIYFQQYLLPALPSSLILALDELDIVMEYGEIIQELLTLVKFCHEKAETEVIWQKLRLILISNADICWLSQLPASPLNFGLSINLPNFTTQQVQDLAQLHGLDWIDGQDAESLMAMVGGHPYLVRLALYHLVGKGGLAGDLQQLLQQAATDSGIYHEYLREYLLELKQQPELASAFYRVIIANTGIKLEPVLASKLESMGLVSLKGDRYTPACELYRLYFGTQLNWIKDTISSCHHSF